MKKKYLKLITVSFVIISFYSFSFRGNEIKNLIVGTWVWENVINIENNDTIGLDMLTMGLTKEVKTEYKKDNTYIEYKKKSEGDGYSEVKGKWKLEENNSVISMNSKGKWNPSKIIKITSDTLILQIRAPFALRMIKED